MHDVGALTGTLRRMFSVSTPRNVTRRLFFLSFSLSKRLSVLPVLFLLSRQFLIALFCCGGIVTGAVEGWSNGRKCSEQVQAQS